MMARSYGHEQMRQLALALQPTHPLQQLQTPLPVQNCAEKSCVALCAEALERLNAIIRSRDPQDLDIQFHYLQSLLARLTAILPTSPLPVAVIAALAPVLWRIELLDRSCRAHLAAGPPDLQRICRAIR